MLEGQTTVRWFPLPGMWLLQSQEQELYPGFSWARQSPKLSGGLPLPVRQVHRQEGSSEAEVTLHPGTLITGRPWLLYNPRMWEGASQPEPHPP